MKRRPTRFWLAALLALVIGACGCGSSDLGSGGDGDRGRQNDVMLPPDQGGSGDGSAPASEGGDPERKEGAADGTDGDLDGESEGAFESCAGLSGISYCRGSLRIWCDERERWREEDCSPGTCVRIEGAAVCVAGETEGEGDPEPASPCDDYDGKPDCKGNTLVWCDERDGWHRQDCSPGVCVETEEGAMCVGGEPEGDRDLEPGDGDLDGDPSGDDDGEAEEDFEPECADEEKWRCSGNSIIYCEGGRWREHPCWPQACIETADGAYCGGQADGDLDMESDQAAFVCAVDPQASGPKLLVNTTGADFSGLFPKTMLSRPVGLCSAGSGDLVITALHLEGYGPTVFELTLTEAVSLPITIPPGDELPINLALYSQLAGDFSDKLVVAGNDPDRPVVKTPLAAEVVPVGELAAAPRSVVEFSGEIGDRRGIRLVNRGELPIEIGEPVISGGGFTVTGDPVQGPLEPGGERTLTIREESGGDWSAELELPWSCPTCPPAHDAVALRLNLTTEQLPRCAEPVFGGYRQARPMETVRLDGSASYDPDGEVLGYRWDWLTKPPTARGAAILDGTGEEIAGGWSAEAFPRAFFDAAGQYAVSLELKDSEDGCTGARTAFMDIGVAPQTALYVELTWNATGADHDLHLVRPGGTVSCEDADNDGDCHFANCNIRRGQAADCPPPPRGCPGPQQAPDWGTTGLRDDDPMMVEADSDGRGPEAIVLDYLIPGDYKIAVINRSGSTTAAATVQVWVGGALRLEECKTISEGGSHQWSVATVHVNAVDDVSVEADGSVEPADCP